MTPAYFVIDSSERHSVGEGKSAHWQFFCEGIHRVNDERV
jgi:hypothetical protein